MTTPLVTVALFTILIGLVTIALFVPVIKGELVNPGPLEEVNIETYCNTDEECENNYNGSLCMTLYPEYNLPFCGCVTNEHCQSGVIERSGICQSDYKCKFPW